MENNTQTTIYCAHCGKPIVRDSLEHDHVMIDPTGEHVYCARCHDYCPNDESESESESETEERKWCDGFCRKYCINSINCECYSCLHAENGGLPCACEDCKSESESESDLDLRRCIDCDDDVRTKSAFWGCEKCGLNTCEDCCFNDDGYVLCAGCVRTNT